MFHTYSILGRKGDLLTQIGGYSGIDLTISFNANRCLVTSTGAPRISILCENGNGGRFHLESNRRALRRRNPLLGYS